MSVGDVNSDARGSGARYNTGKADLSLIPLSTLEDEARVWMYGEKKYARFNWMKGMEWSIPFACMMRHMAAWQRGEEIDPESGHTHLAHAMCNLRMLTLYAKTYPEGDDRPTQWIKEQDNGKILTGKTGFPEGVQRQAGECQEARTEQCGPFGGAQDGQGYKR